MQKLQQLKQMRSDVERQLASNPEYRLMRSLDKLIVEMEQEFPYLAKVDDTGPLPIPRAVNIDAPEDKGPNARFADNGTKNENAAKPTTEDVIGMLSDDPGLPDEKQPPSMLTNTSFRKASSGMSDKPAASANGAGG